MTTKTLSVERAAREIAITAASEPEAFFVLAGAGLSHPQVPIAAGIIDECRKRSASVEPPGLSPMERYSWWLREAYPSNASRQRYIRGLIQGKNVSQGNLRLAHLLLSRKLTNLVVTPNFDDFLTRALLLFGEQPVVCDHPETISKISYESESALQVVHLHGTYSFYDCKNLSYQVEQAAMRMEDTPYSMRGFLDSLLLRRSPLVAGYSGWEKDVFMTALRSRLQRPLKYNIYWFCYRESDLDVLPKWLREHDDVYVIIPSKAGAQMSQPNPATASEKEQGTLSVREVLDTLLREFEISDPPLLADPFEFYREYFDRFAPRDEIGQVDVYFKDVIDVFASARDASRGKGFATGPSEDPLAGLRVAIRRAKYRDAIGMARGLDLDRLDGSQLRDVMSSMQDAADWIQDQTDEEIEAHRLVAECAQRIASGDPAPWLAQRWARALLYRSRVHESRGEFSQALALCEEIVERFGDLHDYVARALGGKGHNLDGLGRIEEAIAAYDEVIARFVSSTEPEVIRWVAWARVDKVRDLLKLQRYREAIALADEVVQQASVEGSEDLSRQLGWALSDKARALEELEWPEEALATFDEIIARFSVSLDASLVEQTAAVLVDKGRLLSRMDRHEEAVAAFDEVVARFGRTADRGLRIQVAWALTSKGRSLRELSRKDEALAAYDQTVARFADSQESKLVRQAAAALVDKGLCLESMGRNTDALNAYDDVVGRFAARKDAEIEPEIVSARYFKASLLASLERFEEALALNEELTSQHRESNAPLVASRVAAAWVNKARCLGKLERGQEALEAYDALLARYEHEPHPLIQAEVARAMIYKARAVEPQDMEAAAKIYKQVIERFEDASEPALQEAVARAFVALGDMLARINQPEAAIAAWDQVIRMFGENRDRGVQAQVELARSNIGTSPAQPETAGTPPTMVQAASAGSSKTRKRKRNT